MATSTRGRSRKSSQMTLPGFINVTGSQASEDGPSLSASPAGTIPGPLTPVLAPANHSVRQANKKPKPTKDTSGPTTTASPESLALTRSLASRLTELLDTDGSMEFRLTWNEKVTPLGRPYCQLAASIRPSGDTGYSGWPNPDSNNRVGDYADVKKVLLRMESHQANLADVAQLAPWACPSARDHKSEQATEVFNMERDAHAKGKPLSYEATLSAWPNLTALGFADSHQPGNNRSLTAMEQLTPWASPTKQDSTGTRNETANLRTDAPFHAGQTLVDQVILTPWASPRAAGVGGHGRGVADTLSSQADQDLASSTVATASRGVLNAAHTRWLMGFPAIHQQLSPNFKSWDLVQSILVELCVKPDATES